MRLWERLSWSSITLTQTILYNSRETRDAVLKSPMQDGLTVSYDRLERLLDSRGREALSA